ncbi:hypothetical protein ACJIZ3_007914 [Penstemon smallii]|uniref:Protein kinase domain-containing protein n=1 Tax=Penstemon smallii TaxID=265156 RepID=A0ABD3TA89_9LAMI
MNQITIWASVISLFFLLHTAKSDEDQVKDALLEFISKLSNNNSNLNPTWNSSSYPCKDKWRGITCEKDQPFVVEIVLEGFGLSGTLDTSLICNTLSLSASLLIIDVSDNFISGGNFEDIANCTQLTHVLINQNQFTGSLPNSFSQLKNLKFLDLSHNQFSGSIPILDFSNLSEFDVSYNNLTGTIPDKANRFESSSFIHNPHLCGPPLPNTCTSKVLSEKDGYSKDQMLMFAGYILIGLAVLSIILLWIYKRGKGKGKTNEEKLDSDSFTKPSFSSVELKGKTDISSTASVENSMVSSSLVVLTSPEVNGLRFEDLLKAPAELIGRGKHGSVYKVACEPQGTVFAVKRIKDWMISTSDFKKRMRRLDLVKHSNVLPAVAFYSSRQEKLVVYEYQQNGSLFKLIHSHGNQTSQRFDWRSRLSVAATISNALTFMHEELQHDKIPHGNLKSSNILLNKNMEPCISEYGLLVEHNDSNTLQAAEDDYDSLFKADTYAFGVILLELLTGRMVLNEGLDLASWVVAVVREEWTVEVFDRNLIGEGASEERLVNMLQVAIKCVNKSWEARPSMSQVASMISAIREEDERSVDVSGLSVTNSFIDV